MVMLIPFFNSRNIPVILKAGLALAASILAFPQLMHTRLPQEMPLVPFGLLLLGELAVGAIIGLSVQMLFSSIQMAGQLLGFQMSFSIANVVDPAGESQVPVLSQFNHVFAMLIFLAVNAHHTIFRAMVESFALIPPLGFQFHASLVERIMAMGGNMFVVAIKIGAPVIIVLLLTSVSLGLMARTVPQMHVFIVAMPLKIAIGLLFIGLSLPFMAALLSRLYQNMGHGIYSILTHAGGGG